MKTGMNLLLWTGLVTEELFPLFAKLKQTGFDGVELPLFGGDAAHALVKLVDRPSFRIMHDTFYANIEEKALGPTIESMAEKIG